MNHPLRWMTLVPLAHAELPTFERISAWYAEHYPQAPPLMAAGATEHLRTVTLGDYTAAATLVPRPIPAAQLEGPAATAWYWPEAAEQLRRQAAHVLVTLVDESGQAVDKAMHLTRLSAAIAATAPSVGVFWGPGRLVHPPAAFIEQAAEMSTNNLPLFLWIDFRVEPLDDGALRLYTTGLEALGGAEIETPHFAGSRQELVGHAYNVAHYQLDRRKTIRDGDTIGLADNVQVTARRGPSMLGGKMEVIRLEFDASAGGGDAPAR
jgi:hypothetical protein